MIRNAIFASLVAALAALPQELTVLHIKVSLVDAARTPVPIARAALLISDDPATSVPRRVLTAADGTATVRLRPGNYIVESDEPVAFGGKGYEWRTTLKVVAGRDAVLELTAANAEVGPAPAVAKASASSPASSASGEAGVSLPPQAQDSVVAIWTPESRASGFLINTAGLVATNQRVVGSASSVEVQISASVKVAARVLVSDRTRDAAILWIDPAAAATLRPAALNCAATAPPMTEGQKLIALGAPLRGQKEAEPGEVFHLEARNTIADFRLAAGSLGGPIFGHGGVIVGLSSFDEDKDARPGKNARVVSVDDVCAAAGVAEKATQSAQRPAAGRLPVEPERPTDASALDAAVRRRQGNLNPYQLSSSNFDVSFLTPIVIRGAQLQSARSRGVPQATQIVATDFGDWSDYFEDVPQVLVVRVTPKMAEGFWTSVARGAAYTQGVAIPSMKHFKPGFLRLRAYCGDAEVMPIHPFTLTQWLSATDAIREGLYVFEPQALGPQCPSVKLVMFSEKEPEKPDTKVIDPKIIERIRDDFAS